MKKKLSIVGKGTVGCISILHFLKHSDFDIDWIFDPNMPTASVGEGTTIRIPRLLSQTLNFNHTDLTNIGGTVKQGIYKENWGTKNDKYFHPFSIDATGMHMSAVDLQSKVFEYVSDSRCRAKIIEQKVENPEELNSDYVLVCSGTPKEFDENFEIRKYIPVNTCYVNQCFWDYPRFTHTLTIARPYGWVFGIPLQKRCSIGYLFNRDINNLDEVKEDIQNIFEQFNLTPSDKTNYIEFRNYSRKNNFTEKVVYNGNASFFLEPLEATSTCLADDVNRLAWDLWHGNKQLDSAKYIYKKELDDIEAMICLHYFAGSKFKNKFWENAKKLAEEKLNYYFSLNTKFSEIAYNSLHSANISDNVGTWPVESFNINLLGLGIEEQIKSLYEKNIK